MKNQNLATPGQPNQEAAKPIEDIQKQVRKDKKNIGVTLEYNKVMERFEEELEIMGEMNLNDAGLLGSKDFLRI